MENDKLISFSDIKSNSQNSLENLSKLQEEHKKRELDLEFAQFNEDIKQILKGNKPSLCRIESKHSKRPPTSKINIIEQKPNYEDSSRQYAESVKNNISNIDPSYNQYNEQSVQNTSNISKKNENEKIKKKETIRDIMRKRMKKEEQENEQILNMFAKKNNEYVKNCFIKKKEMEKMSQKLGKTDVLYKLNLCNELPFFLVEPEKRKKKDYNKDINKNKEYVGLKEIDIQWRNLDKQIKRDEIYKERQKMLEMEKKDKQLSLSKDNSSNYIKNNDNNRDKKKEEHKKEITENLERCSHLKEHLYNQLKRLNKKFKIPQSDVIEALKFADFPFEGEQYAELFESETKDNINNNINNNEKDDLSDYN